MLFSDARGVGRAIRDDMVLWPRCVCVYVCGAMRLGEYGCLYRWSRTFCSLSLLVCLYSGARFHFVVVGSSG